MNVRSIVLAWTTAWLLGCGDVVVDTGPAGDAGTATCTAGSCGQGMACCHLRGAGNEPLADGVPPVCVADCNWSVGIIACQSDADCASVPSFTCDGALCHN